MFSVSPTHPQNNRRLIDSGGGLGLIRAGIQGYLDTHGPILERTRQVGGVGIGDGSSGPCGTVWPRVLPTEACIVQIQFRTKERAGYAETLLLFWSDLQIGAGT